MSTLAERLAQAMEIRGMKAAELSRLSGVPAGKISMIVNGKTLDPRGGCLADMGKVLNVSLDWLIAGDESKAPR